MGSSRAVSVFVVLLVMPLPTALALDTDRREGAGRRAALGWSDCPENNVCVWEHPNFGGLMKRYPSCCAWNSLGELDNQVSSWRNRKDVDAKLAKGVDGNGDRLCLDNNSSNASLGTAWNDAATSIKVFSGSGAC